MPAPMMITSAVSAMAQMGAPRAAARIPSMPPGEEILVHARGLTRRCSGFTAVDSVNFDVRTGEAFGFLGPNGAGKTSTMKMIACSSPVTDGDLSVIGMDPRTQSAQIKARLGGVPQTDNLDAELTGLQNPLRDAAPFA